MTTQHKMFSVKSLSRIVSTELAKNKDWPTVLKIVKMNSTGKSWLMGGAVSRTLAQKIYGAGKKKSNTKTQQLFDFDVVTQKPLNKVLFVPKGWSVAYKKFGNPTFSKGKSQKVSLDLWYIGTQEHIKNNKLKPTISNFLNGTSYTIQTLGYDIQKNRVMGKKGISALKNRVFEVNSYPAADREARRKGTTIKARTLQKAASMDFKAILPKQD